MGEERKKGLRGEGEKRRRILTMKLHTREIDTVVSYPTSLSAEDTFQDPQWMPKTIDST